MFTTTRGTLALFITFAFALAYLFFYSSKNNNLPIVAIANYGPHATLTQSIQGLKTSLAQQGFRENEQIRFEISDVNFQATLIGQMLAKLKAKKPAVIVVMGTPIAQSAKNTIKDIPLIFNVITDPLAAGLLITSHQAHENLSGASDKQDLILFLEFAKSLLPKAKTVGLLYASSEANDVALVGMMKAAGQKIGIAVYPIAIDNQRDIPFHMQAFKDKVDFLYVGVSGTIQPALPAIAALAEKMQIPVFNVDAAAVKQGLALASFGVSYYQVGVNAGNIVANVLNGEKIANIAPIYPRKQDHQAFLNKKLAARYHIKINDTLQNITIVE